MAQRGARAGSSQIPGERADHGQACFATEREENRATEESGESAEQGENTPGALRRPKAEEASAGRRTHYGNFCWFLLLKIRWYLQTVWSFAFFFLSFHQLPSSFSRPK